MSNETYESAGVNIAAGEEAVERITPLIEKTLRPEVLTKIGGFGGAFDITQTGRAHPVLVSSTDGVGTCLLYTSPSPRDATLSRMPSSA